MNWQTTGKASYIIKTLDEYDKIWQPCIYAWHRPVIKHNNKVDVKYLYIGCSMNGTYRISNHQVINKVEPFMEDDRISFYFFPIRTKKKVLLQWERHLIRECKPILNKQSNEFIYSRIARINRHG